MKRCIALAVLSLVMAGCATPVILLRNDATLQVARCGGDVAGSIAGGLIGYNIQKSSDEACARDYEGMGFKRVGQ